MRKLLLVILVMISFGANATDSRNQGAINNLCQNLANACAGGDKPSCQASKDTGCNCDKETGTCARGDYSENNSTN